MQQTFFGRLLLIVATIHAQRTFTKRSPSAERPTNTFFPLLLRTSSNTKFEQAGLGAHPSLLHSSYTQIDSDHHLTIGMCMARSDILGSCWSQVLSDLLDLDTSCVQTVLRNEPSTLCRLSLSLSLFKYCDTRPQYLCTSPNVRPGSVHSPSSALSARGFVAQALFMTHAC